MRNLNLLYHRVSPVPVGQPVNAISLDTITPHKYYGITQDKVFSANDAGPEQEYDLPSNGSDLLGFEYLALNGEFCVAQRNTLSVFHPKFNLKQFDEVAFFDEPVVAMNWSPDQEIVAVVTQDLRCVVLNSVYDTLSDTNLIESGFGEEEFVNVGWGKKETQFHGSAGKHARKAVETGVPITESIDARCQICWRGDGAYFVVIFSFESRRLFKVFDKEGQLKFTSERCHGLDGPVAWRPSGLWIAVPQLLADDKYCIALFERNGLRHRELLLPFTRSQELVTELGWSLDSEVLMVVTRCKEAGTQKVYLYTINNYHWYLKQTLRFDCAIQSVKWDPHPVNGKTLHLFLISGEYHKFKWSFDICRSSGKSTSDEGMVAVIDGSQLLLSNFRSFVIPPPMSSFQLPVEDKVNQVGFISGISSDELLTTPDINQFFIVTDTNKVRLYSCVFESFNNQVTKKIKEVQLKSELSIGPHLISYHWNWIEENTLVYSTGNKLHLVNSSGQMTNELDLEDKLCHNVQVIDAKSLLIGYTDGTVEKLGIDLKTCQFLRDHREQLFNLPTPCQSHAIVTIDDDERTIYSLNPSEMLYRDGVQFIGDITSMCRIGAHLAVTTVDELKFINLLDKNAISERKIERGGLLVTIVANDSRTVLQMPRGNLETIKPRTLSVAIVGKLLDNREYAKSYDILRRERINLNLIVDHDPEKFFTNIVNFIEQVNNPSWLNLFLAELRNEDVTETIYAPQYVAKRRGLSVINGYKSTEKINFICNRFCQVTEEQFNHAAWLMLPKITSYVKRGNLETALGLIWNLKRSENENGNNNNGTVGGEEEGSAEDALKYLLYLVNVDDLFNVALGMYDFDLVLFVARKSQKDPKEYLPFMNSLKQLEETYRKFQIDLHLKRYQKAVTSGIECGRDHFEECLKVIQEQVLYGHTLDLLEARDERYRTIALKYGDHLREKGKLREAGFMYEKGGDLESALSCAQKTLHWERCMALKRRTGASEGEVRELAESLVGVLVEKGNHTQAAQLCETVLRDSERLLNIFIDGNLFERAAYASRTEEELARIREQYEGFHQQVMNALEEDFEMFRKQKLRLTIVRKEKEEKLLNPDDNGYDMDCDLYSDTTSMRSSQHTGGTRGTGKSFRSSKNRRKHERKLLNLKEGNVFEDIALIDSLHGLVGKLYGQQEVIRETLQAAIALNMIPLGRKLQKFYKSLLEEVRNSLDEIWIPEMIVGEQIELNDEVDLTQLAKGQHFALIKPHQRFKPLLSVSEWEFEMFK